MDIDAVKISLPLKKTFAVAKGAADVKTNVVTIMNNRYSGEASGSVYYGPSIELIENDISRGIEYLKSLKEIDVATLKAINEYDIHPIARSALSGMVLNFLSGESQRYPWEILSIGAPVGIKSSFTVSIDTMDRMIAAVKGSDHTIIKIKMGNEDDVLLLEPLSAITGHEIRVDANGGWNCEKAEEMIFHLSNLGVRIIEQPTEIGSIKEWKHLKGKNDQVELIVDEGLCSIRDYDSYAGYVDGVNIKMEKSGGITEAVAIAKKARTDKKKVMLGCMVESSVGIAQSVYMCALADYHDLDGPLLLENDIASGITYQKELIHVDREIIGGPKLRRDIFNRYITT